jgi:hypothetical protein
VTSPGRIAEKLTMDAIRFDQLLRFLDSRSSRRSALALLSALGLPGLADEVTAARRKKHCRSCGPCKRCANGRCKAKPNGTACGGGATCQGGRCVADSCPAGQKACQDGCIAETACCGDCPRGQVCCTNVGECKDVRNDDDFCGLCANGQCPGGSFCANGACGKTCTLGLACFPNCACTTRVDPAHNGQLVCAGLGVFTCENVTACNADADCSSFTEGFRHVCVSGLCAGKNVCASPCA